MYVLNNQSQNDSGLELRITDSAWNALPHNLKDHYHDEVDDDDHGEFDYGDNESNEDSFNSDGYDQDTTSTENNDSQFEGFGNGDFGGGGSSDDF